MSRIRRFEQLEVWQTARKLSGLVFELTREGPFSRDYGFRSQIRNAAGSSMDNIAEGFTWGSQKVFIRHLRIAKGSAGEVQSQLHRALDWKYIDHAQFQNAYDLADSLISQLQGFICYLERCKKD